MNFKTTIILIVLLAAAGIGLWFTRGSGTATPATVTPANPASANSGAKLTTLIASDVDKVIVTGNTTMTLQKTGGNWRITAPYTADADSFEVDSFIKDITDAHTHGQINSTGPSASATGLAQPRYHVTLATPSKTLSMAVGATSPVGNDLYVQIKGDHEAQVIPTDLSKQLAKGPDALRKTTLVSASADDIKQIVITRRDGSKLALAKTNANWKILSPKPAAADESSASDLVFALTGLRADSFADRASLPKSAMANPQLTVAFSTSGPSAPAPATQPTSKTVFTAVKFGSYEDMLKKDVYVSVEGSNAVAEVPTSSLDSFKKTELDLRNKDIVNIASKTVTRMMIAASPLNHAHKPLTVLLQQRREALLMGPMVPKAHSGVSKGTTEPTTKAASKWVVAGKSANDAKVKTLLDALHPLTIDHYIPAAKATTQPMASYVLSITTTKSAEPMVIKLRDPGRDASLIGSYDGLHFKVGRSILTDLQGQWTE